MVILSWIITPSVMLKMMKKTISWSCNILGNEIDKYGSYKKKWNKKQKEKVEIEKKIRIDPN